MDRDDLIELAWAVFHRTPDDKDAMEAVMRLVMEEAASMIDGISKEMEPTGETGMVWLAGGVSADTARKLAEMLRAYGRG